MPKSSEQELMKSENILGLEIIAIAAFVVMILVYMQQGVTVYMLLIPLVVVGSLFFVYESFKAFLRVVGRELEKGKIEVEEEKGKRRVLMLVCPKCKAKNPSDAENCFRCGEKL